MPDMTAEQRRLLPLIFSVTLTSIMGNALLSPAIPDILDTFDQPQSAAGLLVAATALPGVAVAPIVGLLADRVGRRNVLVPCLAIFGVAGLFVAIAPTFKLMLLARFAMGFGAAGLVNLAIVLISDTFPAERQTYWIGKNAGVLTAALATFPILSGLITDAVGWRWALAPCGLGIVTAAFAWFMLDAGRPESILTVRAQLTGVGDALRNRTILGTLVGGGLAFALIFGVFLAVLPNHLEAAFGLSAGWRGLVIGLPAITSSLTRVQSRLDQAPPTDRTDVDRQRRALGGRIRLDRPDVRPGDPDRRHPDLRPGRGHHDPGAPDHRPVTRPGTTPGSRDGHLDRVRSSRTDHRPTGRRRDPHRRWHELGPGIRFVRVSCPDGDLLAPADPASEVAMPGTGIPGQARR